jgi:hypothetical protein
MSADVRFFVITDYKLHLGAPVCFVRRAAVHVCAVFA